MRQKVGKERSQGDCHPLGHPPLLPELGQALFGPTPAVLCKASSNLRVPSGTEPRPGWRGLAHSAGVQISCLQPNSQAPSPSKTTSAATLLRPTVSVRAPGRFNYFAKSEIVESLFRRGARTHRVFYWPAGGKLHCPRAGGYWQNNSRCFVNILLQQSRAGLISVARGDFISIVLAHND